MRIVVLALLVPLRAAAGDFCGSLDGPGVLRELERYAAGKSAEFHVDCIEQSFGDPLPAAPRARVEAACATALALPPEKRRDDVDGWCVHVVARSGTARAGGRDLVGELMAFRGDWETPPAYETLAATGDERVRAFVIASIERARGEWAQRKKRPGWAVDLWARHRVRALRALAVVGAAEDLALIDALSSERPADGRVTRAARRAREEVGRRHLQHGQSR